MRQIIIFLIVSFPLWSAPKKAQIKEGDHKLTLQWIESSKPGKISFQKISDKKFEVSGEQKSSKNDDFLKVQGTITVVSPKELDFDGQIESKIYHIYEGKVCVRTGPQKFVAHGKRKYWRLKEKINCDGVVTDYVDIYFN